MSTIADTIEAVGAIQLGRRQQLQSRYDNAIANANSGSGNDPEEILELLEALDIGIGKFEADCKQREARLPKVERAAQLATIKEQQLATDREMTAEDEKFATVHRAHLATKERLQARYRGYESALWHAMAARQFLMANALPEVAQRQAELNERRAPLVAKFQRVRQGLLNLSAAEAESLRAELAELDQEQAAIDKAKLEA